MRVKAIVTVLGKIEKNWKDSEGVPRSSYCVNLLQENGMVVEKEFKLSAEHYKLVEANKVYTFFADYNTSNNGSYLKIIDIAEGTK